MLYIILHIRNNCITIICYIYIYNDYYIYLFYIFLYIFYFFYIIYYLCIYFIIIYIYYYYLYIYFIYIYYILFILYIFYFLFLAFFWGIYKCIQLLSLVIVHLEKDNGITIFKIGAKMIVIYPFISEHAIHSDTIIGILYSVFEN